MATMARDAWTDERLDDLNARVDGLDQRMEAGFAEMRMEFRAQNRMLLQLFGGIFATTLAGSLAVVATLLSQS